MDRVESGQEFDVHRLDRGGYRLVRREAPPSGDPNVTCLRYQRVRFPQLYTL